MSNNRESNAFFLGSFFMGISTKSEPLEILEEADTPEPDPEELPDQDWAAQKTEYEQ